MERYKDLEGDYTKKTQAIAKYKKRQDAFDEIMAPFKSQFERAGMDDVGAVRQLLAAHDYLRKDPANAINWLASQYGVDIGAIGNDPALEDEFADPQVKQLQQQVAQLTGFIQNQQTQQQSYEQASTQSFIDQFAAETDASGNPAHPHFETVRSVMGSLISSGNATDLKSAYEAAVYANPELRQAELERVAARQSQAKVKTEAVQKAKKAQRSKVRGSATPAAQALPANASIRDTINASIRQLENGRN
jgi:predicted NBD/HSP70 family sugar kinase